MEVAAAVRKVARWEANLRENAHHARTRRDGQADPFYARELVHRADDLVAVRELLGEVQPRGLSRRGVVGLLVGLALLALPLGRAMYLEGADGASPFCSAEDSCRIDYRGHRVRVTHTVP